MILDVTGKLIIDMNVRQWCKLPYPNHSKGCPNYGKKDCCPPKVCKVTEFFNLNKKHWFAIVSFNLKAHKEKMKVKHSDWSEKQLACCLYWQGTVRKKLNIICKKFINKKVGTIYNLIPEALGIYVIKTAKILGIPIRRNIKNKIYKIALIGYPFIKKGSKKGE